MTTYPGDGGDAVVRAYCKTLRTVDAETVGYLPTDVNIPSRKDGPLSNINYGMSESFDVLIVYMKRSKTGAQPLTNLWMGPVRLPSLRKMKRKSAPARLPPPPPPPSLPHLICSLRHAMLL